MGEARVSTEDRSHTFATERPTVAVVGAGFSGLMAALHLLERPDGPHVRLIERRPVFGCGAAYSTSFGDHLLNVRAANMSAFPDRPTHFKDWLAQDGATADGERTGGAFASRRRYGRYLQTLLASRARRSDGGRLALEADEAVALEPNGRAWRLHLAMGRVLEVDAVVLALGNLPPQSPPGVGPEVRASTRFVADPWTSLDRRVPDTGLAVLVGSGLTMVDVVQRLHTERPNLRFLAISRRGLSPERHLDPPPPPLAWDPGLQPTVRGLLGRMRHLSEAADWRSVVDGLRPHVQTIWRQWTPDQRRRFLRHARPWWDVRRHRLAPAVGDRIDDLQAKGVLSIAAGRIEAIAAREGGLSVAWRPRGEHLPTTTSADLVVNCSGPSGDLSQASDPLIADLLARGRIRRDALSLGVDVDERGRPLAADGAPAETLFCLGPVTRGAVWEITSVPDIRVQAIACAEAVAQALADVAARRRGSAPVSTSREKPDLESRPATV